MTFSPTAWAIDGARTNSSLARRSTYAATGGEEGLVKVGDLAVRPLDVPGAGIVIGPGAALVLNRYQGEDLLGDISETYVAVNPEDHIMSGSDMPAVDAGALRHYLVCVTIGDAEFSQVGHPWMTSSDPEPGTEETFTYVRPFIIDAGNTTGVTEVPDDLGYPAYAIARLEVPAGQSTIQASMIKQIAAVAIPRSKEAIEHVPTPSANLLNGGSSGTPGVYERWPNTAIVTTKIPKWATRALIIGGVEGARHTKAGSVSLRAYIEGGAGAEITNVNESAPTSSSDRKSYTVAGELDVSALRGQTKTFSIQGTPSNTASKGMLSTDAYTSAFLRIRFEE